MSANVLLVEDNPINVKLFKMLLTKKGYSIEVAGTAEEGIELARAGLPDLIILDLQLPGELDGVQAASVLKGDPNTAAIPILVVTAHAFPEIREAAEQAGVDGFITKPVVAKTFLGAVASHLTGASTEAG